MIILKDSYLKAHRQSLPQCFGRLPEMFMVVTPERESLHNTSYLTQMESVND